VADYLRDSTGTRDQSDDSFPALPPLPAFPSLSRATRERLYELDLSDVTLPQFPSGPQVTALSTGGGGDNRAVIVLLLSLLILGALFYLKTK